MYEYKFYGVIIADTSTLKDGLLAFFYNGDRETPLRNYSRHLSHLIKYDSPRVVLIMRKGKGKDTE